MKNIKWQTIGKLQWSENLGKMNWHKAKKKCEELGGRLPTRVELIDLADNCQKDIKDWDDDNILWSSTEYPSAPDYAWLMYLPCGHATTNTKSTSGSYYSRCVKDK